MKAKHFLSTALAVCMLAGTAPPTVLADSKSFGGRSEIKWSDCSSGWGTVNLESGKILKAGEGGKLEDISSSKSVFNQFRYNRGKNYYSGYSDNTVFVYDTVQSDYGAKLTDGKYFYAVYDNANDKNNYKVDMAARFSSQLQQLIRKGDIEAALVAETDNYKGTTNKQRGVANLRFYSNQSSIQQEITTSESWYDGTRTVSADWIKLNSDITRMMLNLRSSRKGLKKFNKSSVQKVRVFLRDSVGPAIKDCGIESGPFTTRKNVNGSSVQTVKAGDTIKYYVRFDEKVAVKDTDKLKLRLQANPQKNTDKAAFDAKYVEVKDDKIIFEYTIPDNTNNSTSSELTVFLTPSKLICGKECITDVAGNALKDDSASGYFSNSTRTVDDTYTRINKRAFEENSKKFYPPVSRMSDLSCNLFGSIPTEIIGSNGAQPTVFGESGTKGPIFRIVLDDEIQKSGLTADTKLKLQVYSADRTRLDGKFVYANLVGARVIGVNDKVIANGIKSDAHTELYFRYLPSKIDGHPIYRVDFAGTYNSDGSFVFADDAITCGGKNLRNISDLEVLGKNLKVPAAYRSLLPLSIGIRIDTEAPSLTGQNLLQQWAKQINADASISFEDDGNLNFTKGASVSLVYSDGSGTRKLKVKLDGSNTANETLTLPLSRTASSKTRASVDLSGIRLLREYPSNHDLYLEYAVYDEAGNLSTNAGQNNIRVMVDNTAPVVTGVEEIRSGHDLAVKYNAYDTGVGKIDDYIEYILKNHQKDTEENLSTNDNKQEININAIADSYDTWQVLAKFRDTVGNVSDWNKSGIYATASRNLQFELSDSADSIVSDSHNVKLNLIKPTDTSNASFEVQYGWKRGSRASISDASSTQVFSNAAELAAFNFASEEIQKKYNNGYIFDGEFTLCLNVTLKPDNQSQKHSQSFYFDTIPPEAVITLDKARDGVNSSYTVNYYLTDDSASYSNGVHVTERNIDFSEGSAPKMTLFIGDKAAEEYTLSSFSSSQTINFLEKFAEDERYRDETEAHIEITLKDKFGHVSTVRYPKESSEDVPMLIDLKLPEPVGVLVSPDNLTTSSDGTYIINSFSEIKSITPLFDDNTNDKLDITCILGGGYSTQRISRDETLGVYAREIKNPLQSDFSTTFDNNAYKYVYNFTADDMGGNYSSQSVSFTLDTTAPTIYFVNTENISSMTNAESALIELRYSYDTYETPDDMSFEVSGADAEVADSSEIGVLRINVKDNGTAAVRITDKMGKTGTKSIEVNCFDREMPIITPGTATQNPETGAAKYGEISFTVSDNDSLSAPLIAITQGSPSDDDFFEDTAASRTLSASGDSETYEQNGYFGDPTGTAFANIIPIHAAGTSAISASYTLEYGAIPDGSYSVYARISDSAGNVTTMKLADIQTSASLAEADTEYTPNSDTPTGGAVTAKVTSDIPVQLIGFFESDDVVEAMKANAKKRRAEGFTYSFGGETKHLTFDEAVSRYNEIAEKYRTDMSLLTDEEKYLVKYNPTDYSEVARYTYFLTESQYTEPVGDMLDYLINECLGGMDYYDESIPSSSGFLVRIDDEKYEREVVPLLMDFAESVPGGMEEALIHVPEFNGYTFCISDYADEGTDSFDTWQIPSEIDISSLTPVGGERTGYSFEILNPLCGREYVTAEELRTVFDSEFDLSKLTYDSATGLYRNPLGSEHIVYLETLYNQSQDSLFPEVPEYTLLHMSTFLEDYVQAYENPFVKESHFFPSMAYGDIKVMLNAFRRCQSTREKFAETVAEKYAANYMSISGKAFSTEHLLTFSDNLNRTYAIMDTLGRKSELPIRIDWIDKSRPHVPQSGISFTVNGSELTERYTNADSAVVSVTLPDEGVYREYRIANIPDGAVGIDEETGADGKILRRGFTLDITENRNVEFDVLNPSGEDTASYRQIYVVDRFDRSAPSCNVIYSPRKPSDGSPVNTDVTVTIEDIKDNLTASDKIAVNAQSYTFTENGSFTFTLTDIAGNETTIPVGIDYIDKNPTELTVEFTSGGQVLDTAAYFTESANLSDYKATTYSYTYNGRYLKSDVEAIIRYMGTQVGYLKISDDSEYRFTYTAKSGSRADLTVSGVKLDKEPPEAEVTYTPIAATADKKDSVRADVKITDNISQSPAVISVSGRDSSGRGFTAADVKSNPDGSYSLTFDNNGFAGIVFSDEAGNTTEVQLSVSSLDRTAPRAFISYSTESPTNSDVEANISLNKLADYEIYDENHNRIKEFSGAFSSYISYIFKDNGFRTFRFRDTSGNLTEELYAAVDNIDKVKPNLTYHVEENKMADEHGNLVNFPGAATIVLTPTTEGDTLDGLESDTILIQNASQSPYHTVMSNGTYLFKYMDKAGNFDTLSVTVNEIDETPPTATDSGNPTSWSNTAPTITVSAVQKAKVKTFIVQNGKRNESISFSPTKNGTYSFMVTDEIGNSSTHRIDVLYVDLNAPVIDYSESYGGVRDIYVKAGEFDRAGFENVTAGDTESGLAGAMSITYPADFDPNTPGEYEVMFSAEDLAGNKTELSRIITVMGLDDVYAVINSTVLIPNTQSTFTLGKALELSFMNAENAGNKVSYAFAQGFYNAAQMKGKSFKALTASDSKVTLTPDEPGMYTLFVQTEDRKMMVMYVFIAG